MDWMTDISVRAGLHAEYIETTGAVLAGRDGFDSAIGDSRPYGGAWEGPIFVLTHHPRPFQDHDVSPRMVKGRSMEWPAPPGGFGDVGASGQAQGADGQVAQSSHDPGPDRVLTWDLSS